jgi:hypothetical protein
MNVTPISAKDVLEKSAYRFSDEGRQRLFSLPGEPLFLADWERALFIHYEVDAVALQRELPFTLDLWHGKAFVSLVAFTMRDSTHDWAGGWLVQQPLVLCNKLLREAQRLYQSPQCNSCTGDFSFHNPPPKGFIMSPQAGWILQAEVVPRLRASIPRNVHCVGSEDAEELIQDSIAIAAKMLHSAEAAGKQSRPATSPIMPSNTSNPAGAPPVHPSLTSWPPAPN